MENRPIDVLGIGNAIVDVIAKADDALLERLGLAKGAMTLIDEQTAERFYASMGHAIECSGGSVANSIAGISSFGGRGAYIGKIRNDQLGAVFDHDIRALGVTFSSSKATEGAATARCLVFVTPDAQRTMATFLGACVGLAPSDIDRDLVKSSKITYLEGYLWDPPQAKEAFLVAMDIAHAAGNKTALSLSDPFCVGRYRHEFRELTDKHVDILFANEQEILSLYETEDFQTAIDSVRGTVDIAVVTRSAKGSVVVTTDAVHEVPAAPVSRVIDTTGAGDLFASGFLYGLTHDYSLPDCARLGGLAAAEIISHYGARPEVALSVFLETLNASV